MITKQTICGNYKATEEIDVIGETSYIHVDKNGNPVGHSHFLGVLVNRKKTIENLNTGKKAIRETWEERKLLETSSLLGTTISKLKRLICK